MANAGISESRLFKVDNLYKCNIDVLVDAMLLPFILSFLPFHDLVPICLASMRLSCHLDINAYLRESTLRDSLFQQQKDYARLSTLRSQFRIHFSSLVKESFLLLQDSRHRRHRRHISSRVAVIDFLQYRIFVPAIGLCLLTFALLTSLAMDGILNSMWPFLPILMLLLLTILVLCSSYKVKSKVPNPHAIISQVNFNVNYYYYYISLTRCRQIS